MQRRTKSHRAVGQLCPYGRSLDVLTFHHCLDGMMGSHREGLQARGSSVSLVLASHLAEAKA